MIESIEFGSIDRSGKQADLHGVAEYDSERDAVGILFCYNGTKIRIEVPLNTGEHYPLAPLQALSGQLLELVISALSTLAASSDVVGSRLIKIIIGQLKESEEHLRMHGYVEDAEKTMRGTDDLVSLLKDTEDGGSGKDRK